MAKGRNQKQKLLYLAQIFMEETDESHKLTTAQLIEKLGQHDISAERKALYADLEELRHFGLDVIADQEGKSHSYYLGARTFELPELKLLVDSVLSSRFITKNKSRELVRKLESLAGPHDARLLQRQVLISGRVKTMNESIYYNVDKIHTAIGENRQIQFHYFQWNMEKKQQLRRGGAWYTVSPWYLWLNDENYYLIAYDAQAQKLKHYRVDKMKNISAMEQAREGTEYMEHFDAAVYTRQLFGMFGGETTLLTIEGEADMVGVFLDRFGTDIPVIALDDRHFRTFVNVAVSPQFLGWFASLGPTVKITRPDSVQNEMRRLGERLTQQYGQADLP